MKKVVSYTALATLIPMLAVVMTVNAAGPRPKRGNVVIEAPASYTLNANWVSGVSQDGGAKGQSIKLGNGGDFAYYAFQGWWDQKLSDVKKIRASFMAAAGTVNLGGSPRISLEVDVDGNGTFDCPDLGPCVSDAVVYLDPAQCSDVAPSGGDWLEADFTGDRTNCVLNDSNGGVYASDSAGTAWSKLVAAYPATAKVWFAFLIQDATTGANYVDRIMLDSAFLTKAP